MAMSSASCSAITHYLPPPPPPPPSFNLNRSPLIRTASFSSLLHNSEAGPTTSATRGGALSTWRPRAPLFKLLSSGNQTAAVVSPATGSIVAPTAEVVRKFYGGINGRDLSSVVDLISDDCVYEDLIFPRPFVGRKEILDFFENFMDFVEKDLQFVIDKLSTEDSSAVGVTWHLEWKGKPFPFSRGCSYYELEVINGKRQIIYGRDSVEPAIKPGKAALVIIRGVTWLLQQFPQLADRL
ncbi:Polyketide cyclase SnoaL-like domain containing protein [Parasponia andersonii]|uniref:Polyketide cyclase SnoaL-like domain containing protein n=1 Tax=Parasponia andersonii TaxID=3476 RepID=A0A2P5DMM9_PARAD|nr:Polyketide cyclase SnoaL-like domain containing protein [Parasponia andersonii]